MGGSQRKQLPMEYKWWEKPKFNVDVERAGLWALGCFIPGIFLYLLMGLS